MSHKLLHGRRLTSLLVLAGFIILVVTGAVLYIVPPGRVAYWVDWRLWGLSKTQWGNAHILGGVLFVITGVVHIVLNWTPLARYLKGRLSVKTARRRELAVATITTAVVLISAVAELPPLRYILDLSTYAKDASVAAATDNPPFGHAELVALDELCRQEGIDPDTAMARLRAAGIDVAEMSLTLEAIAHANGTSPAVVFATIAPDGSRRPRGSGRGNREGRFAQ